MVKWQHGIPPGAQHLHLLRHVAVGFSVCFLYVFVSNGWKPSSHLIHSSENDGWGWTWTITRTCVDRELHRKTTFLWYMIHIPRGHIWSWIHNINAAVEENKITLEQNPHKHVTVCRAINWHKQHIVIIMFSLVYNHLKIVVFSLTWMSLSSLQFHGVDYVAFFYRSTELTN